MRHRALTALFGLMFAVQPLSATPVDALGFGASSKALGGAVAAAGSDASVNHYNPARLVFFDAMQLSIGATGAVFDLQVNGAPSPVEPVQATAIALAAPGNLAGLPVAFGFAAQLPQKHLSKSESIRAADPHWVFYRGRLQLLYTSVNVAVRPQPWWSLAFGMASLATTSGGFQVRGNIVLPQFERSEYESNLTHQVDAGLLSVRYPQLGLAVQATEHLLLGVSYREQAQLNTRTHAQLDADVDATIVDVPIRYDVTVASVRMFLPRQLSLAVALQPGAWTWELDIAWNDWSSYQSPVSSTTVQGEAHPPKGVSIELPESSSSPEPTPPGFRDRLVARVGGEYRWRASSSVTLPFRLGYAYEPSPVPAQHGRTWLLDSDRHLLSAGFGSVLSALSPLLPRAFHLDLALQAGLLRRRAAPLAHAGHFWAASGDLTLEF